jgi:hypothetical protein
MEVYRNIDSFDFSNKTIVFLNMRHNDVYVAAICQELIINDNELIYARKFKNNFKK